MADFTDQDKELLDKLRKAFEKKGKTRLVLEPWDEHFDRDVSSSAARSVLAAKIVEGFSGSWAAQYHFGWGSQVQESTAPGIQPLVDNDPDGPPVPIRAKTNHVGQRGVPELNFAPYNWRTNTMGGKGPSVVGHPISFEVVGPTLKSPFCDWTWSVDQGGGPNGGDLLTPSVRPDGAVSPLVGLISDMYGPAINGTWTIGDAAEPNGGLYLLVADDGANPGALAVGQTPMGALPNFVDTARYEIFRISEIGATTIEIHPNKSFSNFFDLPPATTRFIRAIAIVKPYVTRLQAIPQSGAAGGNDGTSTSGREQTFVVLSPERAAGNDNYPPYVGAGGPGVGDGSWLGGGFSEARAPGSGTATGAIPAYGGAFRLPIPIPVLEVTGTVEQAAGGFPSTDIGQWGIETPLGPWTAAPFSPSNLPIIRISATFRNSDLPGFAFGSVESCLGWFDVFSTTAGGAFTGIIVNRVPETDPRSGLTYWGPGPYVSSVAAPSVSLGMTLHEAVDTIWLNTAYQADKVEAARIKNIIDPTWVERFEKQVSDPTLAGGQAPPPPASGPGRPDKAIFDTRTFFGAGLPQAANPGNLMDLGFRAVFFPIKEDPNDATQGIPDFNNPIDSREVVIDGSIAEKQWIDMDYSAGLVRLSHPPPTSRSGIPDEPSEIIPNGIQGDTAAGNNPRGEVVLFAACVPYSMEPGQAGTGSRVTTTENGPRDTDATSEQLIATIDQDNTTFVAVPPYIGVSPLTAAVDIVLDRALDCPETGVITINSGNADSPAFGRWTYSVKKSVLTAAGFRTALGLVSSNPSATDPTPAGPHIPRGVIIRREAVPYEQSLDLAGLSDFYIGDTTYGSSIRTDTLRFKNAQTEYNMDGSVTIDSRTPGYMWNQQGQWGTSGIFVGPGDIRRISDTGLLGGVYYQNVAGGTDATPDATNGATVVDTNGQYTIIFSAGAGDFNGIVTRKSFIYLPTNFRLVIKFRLNADATPTVNQFLGLIGPADLTGPPPVTSLVFNAAVSPPTPSFSYLGLRFDGAFPVAPATFFAQNLNTPGSAQTHTTPVPWSQFQNTTNYLVIESEPFFDLALTPSVAPGHGAYVKMALFDAEFNELARTRFYDQEAVPYDTTMELVVANWSGPGAGVLEIHLYDAVIVNRTNLPFLTIP